MVVYIDEIFLGHWDASSSSYTGLLLQNNDFSLVNGKLLNVAVIDILSHLFQEHALKSSEVFLLNNFVFASKYSSIVLW